MDRVFEGYYYKIKYQRGDEGGNSVNKVKKWALILLLVCLASFSVCTVQAKAAKKGWVTAKNGNVSYYNEKGKKSKGFIEIENQKYYFDKSGIQRTGWRKIGKNYYFFRLSSGNGGYCVKNKKVNGVRLGTNGRAVLTSYSKRKLALMVKANSVMDKITNNTMTKRQKLRAAFNQTKKLPESQWGGFKKVKNWDMYYAERAFQTGRADCYACASYFAYLANAAGYKVKCISSGQHGWAEIGGKIYDAAFSRAYSNYSYFGNDYNLSGKNGFPCFKGAGRYFITL